MSLFEFPCPEWVNPEPFEKLPFIATAASRLVSVFVKQNKNKYILGHGDLKDWHRALFERVVPVPYYAGNYRSKDLAFPCLDTGIHVAGVRGAEASEVPKLMAAFSRQISEHMITTDRFVDAESNPLIKLQAVVQLAAFASGSVIQIHPFLNGNGRIARLLANFILNRYGYRMPFYIARPGTADYALASAEAMRTGNFTLLYQYLLEILALQ